VTLVAVAAGYAGYRYLRPSEEDRLRATLEELADLASAPKGEGDLPRLVRVQRIRDYLLEELLVEVEGGPVWQGREEIVGALAQASVVGQLRMRFADVSVRMAPDVRTSAVSATIEIEQSDPRGGGGSVDAREVEMTWLRPGSSWMLSRATVVRPLE
jgi:hypothetical protein